MEYSNNSDVELFKKGVEADLEDALEHGMIVGVLARELAKEMKKDKKFIYEVTLAGVLHDIGKMRLSRYLYWRNDVPFRIEELKYVRMHSTYSYDFLKTKGYSDLILEAIYYHHENYDGSGYPMKLEGEQIPESARILRVCDMYAALISDRPYRKAFDKETAIELMIEEVKNFDMRIFLAFQAMINSLDIDKIVSGRLFEKDSDCFECIEQYFD